MKLTQFWLFVHSTSPNVTEWVKTGIFTTNYFRSSSAKIHILLVRDRRKSTKISHSVSMKFPLQMKTTGAKNNLLIVRMT